MELTGGRRASLLAYCRIEEDELTAEDEVLLETMYWAAVGYMAGAGVAAPAAGTPRRAQYDLCVNALVLDDWDRRGTTSDERGGYTVTENRSFRHTLNQLKLTAPLPGSGGDVSDLDTSPGEDGDG